MVCSDENNGSVKWLLIKDGIYKLHGSTLMCTYNTHTYTVQTPTAQHDARIWNHTYNPPNGTLLYLSFHFYSYLSLGFAKCVYTLTVHIAAHYT